MINKIEVFIHRIFFIKIKDEWYKRGYEAGYSKALKEKNSNKRKSIT